MQNLAFLGFPNYSATQDGHIYSHTSKRFLKNCVNENHHDKYAKVHIPNSHKVLKVVKVHRLVAYAFLPKPFGKNCVNHKDGDIHNNNVDNLEWVDYEENNKHSMKYVRKPQFLEDESKNLTQNGKVKNRNIGRYKMTEDEAHLYCQNMLKGYRACDLVVLMGINRKVYSWFKFNKHPVYNHVSSQYDFSKLPTPNILTEENVTRICEMLQEGDKVMYIYKTLKVGRSCVRDIKDRKTYLSISKNYSW